MSELWHIGDVVIAMPFLAALRRLFPGAKITLLAESHARETLANTGLVDEVVSFSFPWTFLDEDRRPKLKELLQIPGVIRRLRRGQFDLAFDCSRDGRNHLLLFLTGAARRIGFAFGGGEYLLTDPLPVGSLEHHRTEDWLRLLEPFRTGVPLSEPRLAVSEAERQMAKDFLRRAGRAEDEVLIAIHPGGSSRLKRWSLQHFEALARIAVDDEKARILWIVDPAGTGSGANLPAGSIVARPSLRELIALLSECQLLVSNDGGPMHLAAALGVPTFAIYSWGNPEWWKPYGPAPHSWVRREDITCRPCAGHCIFSEPICLTGLELEVVVTAYKRTLTPARDTLRTLLSLSSPR
ncbi:MAG TPA: glycosyltransferase family 9 protein [Gemmatimonadaceae bacterium]|nr:glycosyltransferase family 9 protein [Gemmatimonadaceae bacterium]